MKNYVLFLLALIFCYQVNGQIYITDTVHCHDVVVHASVTGITPINSALYSDDSYSGVLPIGFTFNFYGTPNTQFIIGENGCLCFDLTLALGYNPWPISGPLLGNTEQLNTICGPWCDIEGTVTFPGQPIYYSTQGVAPNRTLAVTWCGVDMFSCTTQWTTTQIILYEGTNVVEVHVGHKTVCTGWNGGYAIVGVQNATGTSATTAPGRDYPSVWTATDEAWRFTPAPGPSYTVSSIPYSPIPYSYATIYWYDSTTGAYIDSGANIVVDPTVPTTYMAAVVGCDDTSISYIHILPPTCVQPYSNSPCIGDSLKFWVTGDSTGDTYYWYGPAGFTSTSDSPAIFPTTFADTGMYYIIKTAPGGVVHDTDSLRVVIHPLPVVLASSSLGLCDTLTGTLVLTASLDSAGETFNWSGPQSFTSTLQTPTISPFDSSEQGIYTVTGTSMWGCSSTTSTNVYGGTVPRFNYFIHRGCYYDTVSFVDLSTNASYNVWDFGDGDSSLMRDVTHIYPATTSTVFHVSLTTSNAHCTESVSETVDTRHSVIAKFWPSPDTFCVGATTMMLDSSTTSLADPTDPATNPGDTMTIVHYAWDYGNGITDSGITPSYSNYGCGSYKVTLTVTDSIGCTSTATEPVYVVQLSVSSFTDTTLCISQPLPMSNIVSVCPPGFLVPKQFIWTQNTDNLSDSSIQNPTVSGVGTFVDTLTISYPGIPGPAGTFGCAVRDTVTVNAVVGKAVTGVTASATIEYGGSIQLTANNEVLYYWKPDDGTLSDPNINNPIANPTVSTLYTVYGLDVNGCLDSANVMVYVDSSSPGGMPTGFTPNNDGLNDFFRPYGLKYAHLIEFRVYNRWGEEIYYTNKYGDGWDGKYKGVPQDIGTYYYSIIVGMPGGENVVYKGNVTLIR